MLVNDIARRNCLKRRLRVAGFADSGITSRGAGDTSFNGGMVGNWAMSADLSVDFGG
jgi:hypothetical protein